MLSFPVPSAANATSTALHQQQSNIKRHAGKFSKRILLSNYYTTKDWHIFLFAGGLILPVQWNPARKDFLWQLFINICKKSTKSRASKLITREPQRLIGQVLKKMFPSFKLALNSQDIEDPFWSLLTNIFFLYATRQQVTWWQSTPYRFLDTKIVLIGEFLWLSWCTYLVDGLSKYD